MNLKNSRIALGTLLDGLDSIDRAEFEQYKTKIKSIIREIFGYDSEECNFFKRRIFSDADYRY